MNKPRIFINIHYMEIGGAERALLGLLNALDPNRVEVDLFVNQHTGEFMKLIPAWVNLLPEHPRYATIEKPMKAVLLKGHVDIVAARLLARAAHARYARRRDAAHANDASIFHYVAKYTTPLLPSLKKYGEYDLAISFLTPHQIVRDKVKARKKLAWIHTDYTVSTVNEAEELPVWDAFDNIVSISPEVTNTFVKAFPALKPKIIEIENILSPAFVRAQAEMEDVSAEISRGGGKTVVNRTVLASEEL
jgi:glycosyltransferase involved in cell wall biosynthesis